MLQHSLFAPVLTPKTLSLYDYQAAAINQAKRIMLTGEKRVMIMAPTGAGKGEMMVALIKSASDKGRKVLIIVDAISLIEQFSERMDGYGIDHHIIQADHPRRKEWLPVHLASAQTLARRTTETYNLIIVDEAHVAYDSTRELLNNHGGYAIGFSATPFHARGKEDWHNLIIAAKMKELFISGKLSPYVVYAPAPPDLTGVTMTGGDFNQKKLANKMDKPVIVGDVVKSWLRLGKDRLTMCFGVNIAHSKHLCAEFNRYNIKALHVDSWDDKEVVDEAIRLFKSQEIKVLCSVAKLIKGFDVPEVGCIVDAAPTKSLMRHIQKWGRGFRIAEGKEDCIILDHAGNLERNGYCEDVYITDLLDQPEHKSENIKREKPLPKPCASCGFDSHGTYPCPMCGHIPEKPCLTEHEEGELARVDKVSSEDKQAWYAMFLAYAKSKGYSDGWAAHAFKDKFKAWPHKKVGILPKEPNSEVMDFITHRNIKKARANDIPKSCRYCGSSSLVKTSGNGISKAQVKCGSCQRHIKWING